MEEWIQWKPIKELSSKYYIKSLVDQIENFKVILTPLNSEKGSVELVFKYGVEAYTKVEESFRVKLIHDLDKKYGINFYGNWTFFKINNSKYISWLSEQSYQWSDTHSFIHLCLVTSNAVVDIITTYEPKVEIIDNEKNKNK
jgi:hypothetical protein